MITRLDFDPKQGFSNFQLSLFRKIVNSIYLSKYEKSVSFDILFCGTSSGYFSPYGHCIRIKFDDKFDEGIWIYLDSVNLEFRNDTSSSKIKSYLVEVDAFSSFEEMENYCVSLLLQLFNATNQ